MRYRPEEIRDETGKWLNSGVFREEAVKFKSNGYYNSDPPGSVSYRGYWDEQLRRCKEGYEVGGHKITQHHYNYLNFTPIKLVKIDENDEEAELIASKEVALPDFWDGDYNYYWSLEIAKNGLFTAAALATTRLEKEIYKQLPLEQQKEEKQRILKRLNLKVIPHPDYLDGGNHLIVGKSRRKGYSYKNAAICANTYNTIRNAITIIGAFDKKYLYPNGTMGMASAYLSYYNDKTAFTKGREFVDKQEHRKASFAKFINGAKIEAGYKSEIMAITFKDNPDAARGKDPLYVLFEEAGKFPNLRASYNATRPGLGAGRFITGQMLVFGTGGDMEVGTVDFAHMFYNPIEFGAMPFVNIWDENSENSYCSFFHPVTWNMEGFYDDQGNSLIEEATAYEKDVRKKLVEAATSSLALQERVQEAPLCPREAFLTVSVNDFPIAELTARKNLVESQHIHLRLGQPVRLEVEKIIEKEGTEVDEDGNLQPIMVTKSIVIARPDLHNVLDPLWTRKPKNQSLDGAVVIYEAPVPNAPRGLYKIGYDPYRHSNGESLASIIVYKAHHRFSATRNMIVAEYTGRPGTADTVNRIFEMLCEYYNTQGMHENEVTHVKDYFIKRKRTHLLARQPDSVITKVITDSRTKRVWGCHMIEKLKDAGEKYIKEWLLEERDVAEDGTKLTNIDFICNPAFLDELINYNRKGNFDRVMAFMMVMFQCADEMEGQDYGTDDDMDYDVAEEVERMLAHQYSK